MISSDHVLELVSVVHTGQLEPGSCFQKLTGSTPSGLILKDVSMEVHAGEVMALLGSKGSGKRALLEVIARRALGPTRGQILLNDVPVSLRLFQEQCAFVPRRLEFVPGLTVRQTLEYRANLTVGSKVSHTVKRNRVKQVMADLALNQVANREVSYLTASEERRLAIAMELVRDPVLVLLDEPTLGLDPLNSYFVVSILSNHAKKANRIVVLSMEQPRSDVFPFLDSATYLCLGEVVYSGSTRMMLDYFRSIGFPCPELENPLMYYLCLSTVDRRTRERFIESSTQIAALVEKFKIEGSRYRKLGVPAPGAPGADASERSTENPYKLPLTAYGKPSSLKVFLMLVRRAYGGLFNCNTKSLRELLVRLVFLPMFFAFLFLFYFQVGSTQQGFITRNGLIFNCLALTSCLSAALTAVAYSPHRNRYYQESRAGLYRGPLFIFSYLIYSVPLSIMTVWAAATVIYAGTGLRPDWERWAVFCATLWSVWTFAEHQTISLMMFIKSSYRAFLTSLFILIIYITFASSTVRSLLALPDWLYYLSYGVIYRYAGAFLNQNEFDGNLELQTAPSWNGVYNELCPGNNIPGRCLFLNGTHYLTERYHFGRGHYDVDLQYWMNFGLTFVFVGGMWLVNIIAYLIPLPAYIKSKFRD